VAESQTTHDLPRFIRFERFLEGGRLEKRMVAKGFTPDDRLLQIVRAAQDDLHRVIVELHYRACDGGVARKD
jgi:hypothetical protein